jgi:hypothetical protein
MMKIGKKSQSIKSNTNELLDPFFRKIVFDRAPVQQVLDEIAMKFDSGT